MEFGGIMQGKDRESILPDEDILDFEEENSIYVLISCKSGSLQNEERIRKWLSVRLNEKNLRILTVDEEVITGAKEENGQ